MCVLHRHKGCAQDDLAFSETCGMFLKVCSGSFQTQARVIWGAQGTAGILLHDRVLVGSCKSFCELLKPVGAEWSRAEGKAEPQI